LLFGIIYLEHRLESTLCKGKDEGKWIYIAHLL